MDFRIELSDQAQRDIAAIYDWLHSQQAGDAGERWFVALRPAIASLASLPSRCPVATEVETHPLKYVNAVRPVYRMRIESCSPSKVTWSRCFISDTAGVGL
jgi:plasmid stabilization system protein ParE